MKCKVIPVMAVCSLALGCFARDLLTLVYIVFNFFKIRLLVYCFFYYYYYYF